MNQVKNGESDGTKHCALVIKLRNQSTDTKREQDFACVPFVIFFFCVGHNGRDSFPFPFETARVWHDTSCID